MRRSLTHIFHKNKSLSILIKVGMTSFFYSNKKEG